MYRNHVIVAALLACMGSRAFGQVVPLLQIHSTGLSATAWQAAPLPDGHIAVAAGDGGALYYKMDIDTSVWGTRYGTFALYDLYLGTDQGLYALVKNTGAILVESIALPSLHTDTLVNWPHYQTGDYEYGSLRTVNYRHGIAAPHPPQICQTLTVDANVHFEFWTPPGSHWGYDSVHIASLAPDGSGLEAHIRSFPLDYAYVHGSCSVTLGAIRWTHSNALGWETAIERIRICSNGFIDTLISLACFADYPVTSPTAAYGTGMCEPLDGTGRRLFVTIPTLAGGQGDSLYAVELGQTGYIWAVPSNYSDCFSCDAVPSSPGDEIYCLVAAEHRFDVRSSNDGSLLATTTTFAGDPADLKLIGGGSPQRAVAVRDGDTLRVYSIGDVLAAEPIALARSVTATVTLSTFPEPAHDRLSLALSSPLAREARIVVYDLLGRQAAHVRLSPNSSAVNMDVSSLPAGIYFARLEGQPTPVTRKFVVLK